MTAFGDFCSPCTTNVLFQPTEPRFLFERSHQRRSALTHVQQDAKFINLRKYCPQVGRGFEWHKVIFQKSNPGRLSLWLLSSWLYSKCDATKLLLSSRCPFVNKPMRSCSFCLRGFGQRQRQDIVKSQMLQLVNKQATMTRLWSRVFLL